jgi:acyl-CoA thioester hydrolase
MEDSHEIETYRGAVYPWHCDHMGHMNVMWYVGKFDEATWQLLGGIGLSAHWLREHGRGMVASDQRLSYQRELLAGDIVLVRSMILEVRSKAIRFAHRMFDAATGELCAVTQLVGVHLDTDARRPVALPEAVVTQARARVGRLAMPWDERP